MLAAFSILIYCSLAFASLYITHPTASTVFMAGQPATISWEDNGGRPSLADFGPAKVSIYVGSALQQSDLQDIVLDLDVSRASSIQFTPNPSIGPNSNEYFIRFESLNLKDPMQPQSPALAFSAKFTMNGMTGQFSPAIQSQILGQTSAPLSSGPTAAPSTSYTTVTLSLPTTSLQTPSNATVTRFSSPTQSNTAGTADAGWFGAVVAAMFGVVWM